MKYEITQLQRDAIVQTFQKFTGPIETYEGIKKLLLSLPPIKPDPIVPEVKPNGQPESK